MPLILRMTMEVVIAIFLALFFVPIFRPRSAHIWHMIGACSCIELIVEANRTRGWQEFMRSPCRCRNIGLGGHCQDYWFCDVISRSCRSLYYMRCISGYLHLHVPWGCWILAFLRYICLITVIPRVGDLYDWGCMLTICKKNMPVNTWF